MKKKINTKDALKEGKDRVKRLNEEYEKLLNPPHNIKFIVGHYSIKNIMSAIINYNVISIDKLHFEIKPLLFMKNNTNMANIYFNGDKKYFSYGDNPISADGDYRPNLMNLSWIDEAMLKYENIYEISTEFYKKNIKYISSPVSPKETIIILCYLIGSIANMMIKGYPSNYKREVINLFKTYYERVINPLLVRNFYMGAIKTTAMGVKIIPLYINDVKTYKSNIQRIQREINANLAIRKLIISGICNHFSTLIDWNIFKIDDLNIFSNDDIIAKYVDSEKYAKSLELLYEAGHIKGDVETINTYKKRIMVPITYAEKNLVLSNYGMAFISIYSGSTLANFMTIYIDNPNKYKTINICNSLENCQSLILQISYSLLALNKYCRIIHGDLHLNNVCCQSNSSNNIIKYVYIINDIIYMIESYGYYTIIDFGRCFIDPEQLINEKYDEEYIKIQNKKICRYFGKVLPELYLSNKKEIARHFINNPSKIYHICMGLDLYNFMRKIHLSVISYMIPEVDEYMKEVETYIYDWIVVNLDKLNKNMDIDSEYINHLVIKKFYKGVSKLSKAVETSNYNNMDNKYELDIFDIKLPVNKYLNRMPITRNEVTKNDNKLNKRIEKISKYYNSIYKF